MSILTKDYVNFLSLQSSKKLTNPNSGTGFGTEHVFFSHCVVKAKGKSLPNVR